MDFPRFPRTPGFSTGDNHDQTKDRNVQVRTVLNH
jgi:hypothetical protein